LNSIQVGDQGVGAFVPVFDILCKRTVDHTLEVIGHVVAVCRQRLRIDVHDRVYHRRFVLALEQRFARERLINDRTQRIHI